MNIGMDDINFTMIYILVNDDNKRNKFWMDQITTSIIGYWCNIMIIYSLKFYMSVWGFIDGSNIFTINSHNCIKINQ